MSERFTEHRRTVLRRVSCEEIYKDLCNTLQRLYKPFSASEILYIYKNYTLLLVSRALKLISLDFSHVLQKNDQTVKL